MQRGRNFGGQKRSCGFPTTLQFDEKLYTQWVNFMSCKFITQQSCVFKEVPAGRGGGGLGEAPEAYDQAVGLDQFVYKAGSQLYKFVGLGS